MRVLVTGWPSFVHGEATAGDVLSMRRVCDALAAAEVPHDSAWSPVFRSEALHLDKADAGRYSHLVFVCGPAHGEQVRTLHHRYANCRRIAVGVSVIDPDDAAVTGFHRVLARDGLSTARPDMSVAARTVHVPVVGVILAPGQAEYGTARRHQSVHQALTSWLGELDCARIPLDTRLASDDWRLCRTPDQLASIFARLDAVVTTRLHGLVLGLRAGVPVLAVDPIAGGGKVSAQAQALDWPALISAEQAVAPGGFEQWWHWCLSPAGRARAGRRDLPDVDALTEELLHELRTGQSI
ncbi:polysaccharide pyruvyl transferase family protein [Nocardia suismassiliense]|uniref:polysaccharide pyruvyl transferase family protein n=1 Tax=Nocardia suismassiliense TaxID=2077092 RepID=UPI000D1F9C59|nr:polysaccharide pyruvyl transferase family protein [Nocardia suismassiliense]